MTDRIAQADKVLAQLSNYRTALAIIRETWDFMPALDETDMDEIRGVVLGLYHDLDLSIIESFIE